MRGRGRARAGQSQIEVEVRAGRWHQLCLEMRGNSACPAGSSPMMLHHVLCGAEVVMSACGPKADVATLAPNVGFGSIVLQKSFCTGDQKFCGLQVRLSCKDVGDPRRLTLKLTGDLGNAIEVIRIGDCFSFLVFAKNS